MTFAGGFTEPVLTDRLALCRPVAADVEPVFEIHADPRTNLHNVAGPMRERAVAREWIHDWIVDWRTYGVGYWIVRPIGESRVLGVGGLRPAVVEGERVFNLYYRFRPSAWGSGYAGETARAALQYEQDADVEALPVIALIRPGNAPSARVAAGAGLLFDRVIEYGGAPMEVHRHP